MASTSNLAAPATKTFSVHGIDFRIRDIRPDDLEEVFRGLSHPEVIRYYGVKYDTLEATRKQMEWYAENEANNTGKLWVIETLEHGIFAGVGGVYQVNIQHACAEAGYWLHPEFWGKGLATAAMQEIISYSVKKWNLHRIEASVETENPSSRKVLEKLGFVYEGTRKECELKDGKWISLDIFGKLY